MTEYIKTADGHDYFKFRCQGCDAEGELAVSRAQGQKPFGCPERCGASYVRIKPTDKPPYLACVVCPVWEEGT